MKAFSQILFWLGIASVPVAWLLWYFGPDIQLAQLAGRAVLGNIQDPALKAALQEAHAERWGIFVGIWPVTLLVLSAILENKAND